MKSIVFCCLALLLTAGCQPGADAPVPSKNPVSEPSAKDREAGDMAAGLIDPASGLVIDEHWELVRANCSACHSAQLVTQNRGSRQSWLEMIRWMQATQGLWQFDPATETGILDYLEKNYAPSALHRRAPLPRALMPENPYAVSADRVGNESESGAPGGG